MTPHYCQLDTYLLDSLSRLPAHSQTKSTLLLVYSLFVCVRVVAIIVVALCCVGAHSGGHAPVCLIDDLVRVSVRMCAKS